MEYLLFFVLIIVAAVNGEQLKFKDYNGQLIDWFRVTKLPNLYWNVSDGTVYVYMNDKNTEWTYLTTNKSAIGPTDIDNKSTLRAENNDSPSNINMTIILDNTKGEVKTDSNAKFWLLHSISNVPQTPHQKNNSPTDPKTGEKFSQSFLCISMMEQELDKEENTNCQSGTTIQDDNLHRPEDFFFQYKTLQPEENNDIQQPKKFHQNDVFCEPATVKLVSDITIEELYYKFKTSTVYESCIDFIYGNSELGDNSVIIKFNNEKEIIKYWLPRKPLKVIIHGWKGSYDNDNEIFSIKKAYETVGGYNVIAVDWGRVAKNKSYKIPAKLTKDIGAVVAKLLKNLVNLFSIDPSDIHIIGHSLGAHVAGGCGAAFTSSLGKIGRITGLDPAGPLFEFGMEHFECLDSTDAQFVDVIHTAGGTLGHSKSVGVVDFYPNKGVSAQPGCVKMCLPPWITKTISCSHSRAYEFFAESVYNNNSFISVKCESWKKYIRGDCDNNEISPMGNDANFQSSGNFYLKTNSAKPYSISPSFMSARGNAPFGINEHKKEEL